MKCRSSALKRKLPAAILCVIDANYNRAKEGFRVVEDIIRFIKIDKPLMYRIKRLRHALTASLSGEMVRGAIAQRDSPRDIGKAVDYLEMSRSSVQDILSANLQRIKESLRVLEEFSKLIDCTRVPKIKKLRYQTYELEKTIITGTRSLRHH